MTKQCPNCGEYSFTFRDLFVLDYFSISSCPVCGGFVRNDGLRQFLLIPATMTALLISVVVWFSLPDSLSPFGILLLLLSALTVPVISKPVKANPRQFHQKFEPDPDNDKVIEVSGWSDEQLQTIINDFIAGKDSDVPPYEVHAQCLHDGRTELTFTPDIPPVEFAALVSYLHQPDGIVIPEDQIITVGRLTLDRYFFNLPSVLVSEKVAVYVSPDDGDTGVSVETTSGVTYRYAFVTGSWHRVKDGGDITGQRQVHLH